MEVRRLNERNCNAAGGAVFPISLAAGTNETWSKSLAALCFVRRLNVFFARLIKKKERKLVVIVSHNLFVTHNFPPFPRAISVNPSCIFLRRPSRDFCVLKKAAIRWRLSFDACTTAYNLRVRNAFESEISEQVYVCEAGGKCTQPIWRLNACDVLESSSCEVAF